MSFLVPGLQACADASVVLPSGFLGVDYVLHMCESILEQYFLSLDASGVGETVSLHPNIYIKYLLPMTNRQTSEPHVRVSDMEFFNMMHALAENHSPMLVGMALLKIKFKFGTKKCTILEMIRHHLIVVCKRVSECFREGSQFRQGYPILRATQF